MVDLFNEDPFITPGQDVNELGNSRPAGHAEAEDKGRRFVKGASAEDSFLGKEDRGKPPSHTSRTREWWEKRGWIYTIVEYRDVYSHGGISGVGVTHDLWGSIDALVLRCEEPFGPPGALQNTSIKEIANHVRNKICGRDIDKKSGRARIDCTKAWLKSGGRIFMQGWGTREEADRFLDSQRHYKIFASYRNAPVKPNTKWFAVVIEIDLAIVEGVESRRRS